MDRSGNSWLSNAVNVFLDVSIIFRSKNSEELFSKLILSTLLQQWEDLFLFFGRSFWGINGKNTISLSCKSKLLLNGVE